MSRKTVIHPLSIAMGTLFTVSLAHTQAAAASENPFSMQSLGSGYATLAEGKCGEGKCGAAMGGEGKCGEGKCGMGRMDADGDGKVSKDEFMQGHETMFGKIDKNADGVIDAEEREAHMTEMRQFMKEGKCGPGKFGGSE